jgi:hypothetical protein
VTVLKSLALPILVQSLTVLPDAPLEIISAIQLEFFIFLWSGKSDKLKRNILIGDFSQGGIKMPHILSFYHALKFSWVKKLLDPLNHAGWKSLFLGKVENLGGDNFWMFSKPALNKLQNRFPKFWQDIINVWEDINDNNHTAPENALIQHLWYNPKIKVASKQVFLKNLYKKGVFFINDLMERDGGFMTLEGFNNKYNLNVNFIDLHGTH